MGDDTELLMKAGRHAYQQFIASKIAIKTAGRLAELELDFLEIDVRDKLRRAQKSLEQSAKRK